MRDLPVHRQTGGFPEVRLRDVVGGHQLETDGAPERTDADEPPPRVPVPLLPPDDDVVLDLQRAFTSCYDEADFDLLLGYGAPPDVPLPAPWDKWARKLIRARTA